ncbi:MAG: SRPBCC family protein [Solirubrobacteraceae bacterium]
MAGTTADGSFVPSEVRVGGVWTILFGPSPRQLYRHRHVFTAINRPRRLALSTTETRLDGTTLRFETEFTFEAAAGGTLMAMIQRGLPTDELRAEHGRGVPNAFDRLERHLRDDPTHLNQPRYRSTHTEPRCSA